MMLISRSRAPWSISGQTSPRESTYLTKPYDLQAYVVPAYGWVFFVTNSTRAKTPSPVPVEGVGHVDGPAAPQEGRFINFVGPRQDGVQGEGLRREAGLGGLVLLQVDISIA